MTIRAQGFRTVYGRHIVAPTLDALGRYVVVHHPEPWAVVAPLRRLMLRSGPRDGSCRGTGRRQLG